MKNKNIWKEDKGGSPKKVENIGLLPLEVGLFANKTIFRILHRLTDAQQNAKGLLDVMNNEYEYEWTRGGTLVPRVKYNDNPANNKSIKLYRCYSVTYMLFRYSVYMSMPTHRQTLGII